MDHRLSTKKFLIPLREPHACANLIRTVSPFAAAYLRFFYYPIFIAAIIGYFTHGKPLVGNGAGAYNYFRNTGCRHLLYVPEWVY